MTTSGTYTFDPAGGSLILSAFARIGVRRTSILQEHMQDGRLELNYLLVEASNKQPNLWTVDLVEVPLVDGTATYTLDQNTIDILDAYIRISEDPPIDRMIFPLSRTDYASISAKEQEAPPTSFWFNKIIPPTITLWPVPNTDDYTLKFYRVRQIQDAGLANAQTVEVPYRFLDWIVAGLAHRLSRIYAPTMEPQRKADAMEAWQFASVEDTEWTPLYVTPGLSSYYQ